MKWMVPRPLSVPVQIAVVAAGYVAAAAAAVVAERLYDAAMAAMPYDTSGGMFAGGSLLTALGAFLVVALAPTLLALWFLRRNERFWNGLGVAALVLAAAGLLAQFFPSANVLLELLRLSHLLGAPLWVVFCALAVAIAPGKQARRKLLAGAALEVAACAVAAVHLLGHP
jgi:hypothetical protein